MSTSIGTVTFSSVVDRKIVLENSQIARVIDIGTSWSTIRLAMRFSFTDSGFAVAGTPRLYLGMLASPSASMANGPLGATCSHFVGVVSQQPSWSRIGGASPYYGTIWGTAGFSKKVGNTLTGGSGWGNSGNVSGSISVARGTLHVEIVKGSPNYTCYVIYGSGQQYDLPSAANFRASVEIPLYSGIAAYLNTVSPSSSYQTTSALTLAVNEGVDGALNAVCVAWDRSSPALHISDFAWAKIA